jgi:hypothetical protein
MKQALVEVKSLQLRAASATRHASSITTEELSMVRAQQGSSRLEDCLCGRPWIGVLKWFVQ